MIAAPLVLDRPAGETEDSAKRRQIIEGARTVFRVHCDDLNSHAVIFTDAANDEIGQITPSGQVMEFPTGITAATEPVAITAGPDGNLWFTEAGIDQIGRITPAGQVTQFSAGINAGS